MWGGHMSDTWTVHDTFLILTHRHGIFLWKFTTFGIFCKSFCWLEFFFFLHFGFYLRMSTNDLYRICRIWKQRLYTKTIFNPAAENNARHCPRVSGASPVTICIHTEIVQIFKDCVFPSPVRATCAWTNVRTVSDLWRHEPLSASGHNITAFGRLRRQAYNKIYSNN